MSKKANYDYWLSKPFWTLKETVIILSSKEESLLPHQIKNVSETDEAYNLFAKKLVQELLSTERYRIHGHQLYWKEKREIDGTCTSVECCPAGYDDFLKEKITLSPIALVRVINAYKEKFSSIFPQSLLKKALLIINRADSKSSATYLIKLLRDGDVWVGVKKICSPFEFLRALARLPEDDQKFKMLQKFSQKKITYQLQEGIPPDMKQIFSDLRIIVDRFEALKEYTFIFQQDGILGKLNFLSYKKDGCEKEGRLVDFVKWAQGHAIPIPPEMIAALQSKNSFEHNLSRGDDVPEKEVIPVAGTALGLIIEKEVRLLIEGGSENFKPQKVFLRIKAMRPLPDPIKKIDGTIGIVWIVPTTGEEKIMKIRRFQNVVKEYKDRILGEEKVKKSKENPVRLPSKKNIPDQFPPRK